MIIFADHRTLVYTEISRQDYLVPKLGGTFNASEFEAHPERYRSVFADEVSIFFYGSTNVIGPFRALHLLVYGWSLLRNGTVL